MIQPTDVKVITAEDGTKALAVELVLIVPFGDEFGLELASQLIGGGTEVPAEDGDTPTTEQDTTEDSHEHDD